MARIFELSKPSEEHRLQAHVGQLVAVRSRQLGGIDFQEFRDEACSDAYVAIWNHARKQPDNTINENLVNSIVYNVCARMCELLRTRTMYRPTSAISGSRITAWKEFRNRRDDFEQTHNRLMTPAEQQKLSDDIVDNWPKPRHKPPRNFHLAHYNFDDEVEAVTSVESSLEGSNCRDLWQAVQQDASFAKSNQAKRLVWRALVPNVAITPHLFSAVADQYRAEIMADTDFVPGGCRDYSEGHNTRRTHVLEAPFGRLTPFERDQVFAAYSLYSTASQGLAVVAIDMAEHIPTEH